MDKSQYSAIMLMLSVIVLGIHQGREGTIELIIQILFLLSGIFWAINYLVNEIRIIRRR